MHAAQEWISFDRHQDSEWGVTRVVYMVVNKFGSEESRLNRIPFLRLVVEFAWFQTLASVG